MLPSAGSTGLTRREKFNILYILRPGQVKINDLSLRSPCDSLAAGRYDEGNRKKNPQCICANFTLKDHTGRPYLNGVGAMMWL